MQQAAHVYVDRAVNCLKWPAAAAAVLVLVPALLTLADVLREVFWWRQRTLGGALLAGMGTFAVVLLLRRRTGNRAGFWSTLEHELTHALFVVATLHPLRTIHASASDGGAVGYDGRGNWFISIAPYFFPTVPLTLCLLAWALPPTFRTVAVGIIGFGLAWHLVGSYVEVHAQQTDLHNVGFPFAVAFIPGASLLANGMVLTMVGLGSAGPTWFLARLMHHVARAIAWICL